MTPSETQESEEGEGEGEEMEESEGAPPRASEEMEEGIETIKKENETSVKIKRRRNRTKTTGKHPKERSQSSEYMVWLIVLAIILIPVIGALLYYAFWQKETKKEERDAMYENRSEMGSEPPASHEEIELEPHPDAPHRTERRPTVATAYELDTADIHDYFSATAHALDGQNLELASNSSHGGEREESSKSEENEEIVENENEKEASKKEEEILKDDIHIEEMEALHEAVEDIGDVEAVEPPPPDEKETTSIPAEEK